MNGTEPKHEREDRCDNLLTAPVGKSNETKLEAGWRRGYAADCKSVKTGSIPVPASKIHYISISYLSFPAENPYRPALQIDLHVLECDDAPHFSVQGIIGAHSCP